MHTSMDNHFPSPSPPQPEHLKCPRCDSLNTKFCYYNNYNLSQPRHFCKNCRRYWTKGGTLRNIPIGGGTRKISKRLSNPNKRSSSSSSPMMTPPPPLPLQPPPLPETPKQEPCGFYDFSNQLEAGGYSIGPFGNLLMEGLVSSKSDDVDDVLIRDPIGDDFRSNFLRLNDNNQNNNGGGDGGGDNGWPDLSMFTPGSSFH